jgi:hypothetical protein
VEEWLPVVGYEGFYEVSDHGRVRSLDRVSTYRTGVVHRLTGRVLKPTTSSGRPVVVFSVGGIKQLRQVGVTVLEAFVGPRPPGLHCCHWDDDPMNNVPGNLRWDTPTGNAADRLRNGRGQATKTVCPRGHSLFPPNLVSGPNRGCAACASTRGWAVSNGVSIDDPRWLAEADRRYDAIMDGTRPVPYAKRTHCPRGHELRRPNLVKKSKVRLCLACTNTTKWGDYHGVHRSDPRWIAEADQRYGYIMAGLERPKFDQTKTECKRGHRLVPPNVIQQARGVGCFSCTRARSWAHYYKIPLGDPRWIVEADRRYAEIMSSPDQAVMHTA